MKIFNWFRSKVSPYTIAACNAILFYLILTNLDKFFGGIGSVFKLFSPVLFGIVIAYIVDPFARLLQRTILSKIKNETLNRNIAVFISILAVIAGFVLLIVALVPQLIESVANIANNFDSYVNSLERLIGRLAGKVSSDKIDVSAITEASNTVLDRLAEIFPQIVNRLINTSFSVGTGFLNGVIAFILAIYFLLDKSRLMDGCSWLLSFVIKESHYDSVRHFLVCVNDILVRYVICDLLDGLIVGVINYIFMRVCDMPYAVLISVVVGLTNLAPTFGPIAGGTIGAFVLILINPWMALWFVLFTVILQTCDGYIVKPKLFGGTFGVSSLWILICIIIGGRMLGVIGILVAIPFAAIFDFIIHDYVTPFIQRHDKDEKRHNNKTAANTHAAQGTEIVKETEPVDGAEDEKITGAEAEKTNKTEN